MGVKIHVIDVKEADHSTLIDFFNRYGYQVDLSISGKRALKHIRNGEPDFVFVALDLPDLSGVEVLNKIRKISEDIVFFPLVDSVERGIETMKLGAGYYFVKPYSLEEVKIVLNRCLAIKYYKERVERLRFIYLDSLEKSEVVALSKSIKEVYQNAMGFAEEGNFPILISGEVGTGKEFLAKIIHIRSRQFMFPFVAINCEDRSERLLDSQLFSMKKVSDSNRGEIDNPYSLEGGTFFLYNIECLTRGDQLKLLKLLKGKRSGKKEGADSFIVDKRIISLGEIVTLYVNTVLKKVKGNKSKAARILKVSRNTLKKKSIAF